MPNPSSPQGFSFPNAFADGVCGTAIVIRTFKRPSSRHKHHLRGTCKGPEYINVCNYQAVAVDVENGVCFSKDQFKIPFEDFNIAIKKHGTFCDP